MERMGFDVGRLYDEHTFLRLIRLHREHGALPTFDASRSLTAYVLGVARHVALDLCRRPRTDQLDETSVAKGEEPGRELERRDLVERAMASLEPDHRTALVLRHVSGLSMEELSQALDCSVPTARARVEDAGRLLALDLRRRGFDRKELT